LWKRLWNTQKYEPQNHDKRAFIRDFRAVNY
jgi:hypothetical protein